MPSRSSESSEGEFKRPCIRNVWIFTFCICGILMSQMAFKTYSVGVVRTIEKRFDFNSKQTATISMLEDAVQTSLVMFVGYIGDKVHKPRFIGMTVMSGAIGSFMFAVPFFIFGSKQYDSSLLINQQSASNVDNSGAKVPTWLETTTAAFGDSESGSSLDVMLCNMAGNHTEEVCLDDASGSQGAESTVYHLFLIGSVCFGISTTALNSLGTAYIDNNVPPTDAAMHIGLFTSMFAVGPIIGYLLAAFSTQLPENLVDSPLDRSHIAFIGCYWLGFVILGFLILVFGLVMFIFPRHMTSRGFEQHEETALTKNKHDDSNIVMHHLREAGQSIKTLVTNPAWVMQVSSFVCILYVIAGIVVNNPRYLEIHFHLPAYKANIAAALTGAVTGGLGNILGGLFMKKMKVGLRGCANLYTMSVAISLVGIITLGQLQCSQAPLIGQDIGDSFNATSACNAGCGCDGNTFQPVCSSDNLQYYSPCHAGCSMPPLESNMSFTNCDCVDKDVELQLGLCDKSCSNLLPYLIVCVVWSFLSSIGRVPSTLLTIRVVPKELKAFSLGLISFVINLIVFVPGPMLFGYLIDKACMVWKRTCDTTGVCLMYSKSFLRLYMFGTTGIFVSCGLILSLGVLWAVRRSRYSGIMILEKDVKANFDNESTNEDDEKLSAL